MKQQQQHQSHPPPLSSDHHQHTEQHESVHHHAPLDTFSSMNERQVEDISIRLFYQPHTVTLLIVSICYALYIGFSHDPSVSLEHNIWNGIKVVSVFFLVISSITYPNGPFTRPHPVVWRIVFGASVLYLLLLLFVLCQDYNTVKSIMYWFSPDLQNFTIDMEKEYGVNCSVITVEKIWAHVDVFAAGHLIGWTLKALLVRHYGICWAISMMWELTEMVFAHLLPNFVECWWDALILDVLICNGLGIWIGMRICHYFEMRTYNWESVKDIQSTTGKIRRVVLQFTPASWTTVRWLDPNSSNMRIIAVTELVLFWQVTELNTFFLKHIFELPPGHWLNICRITLIGAIVAPSLRQFYCYVTDTSCKRVGTQCWVFGAIMITELLICVKFGLELFKQTQITNIFFWLVIQFGLSVICVYLCAMYARRKQKNRGSTNVTDEGTEVMTSKSSSSSTAFNNSCNNRSNKNSSNEAVAGADNGLKKRL